MRVRPVRPHQYRNRSLIAVIMAVYRSPNRLSGRNAVLLGMLARVCTQNNIPPFQPCPFCWHLFFAGAFTRASPLL